MKTHVAVIAAGILLLAVVPLGEGLAAEQADAPVQATDASVNAPAGAPASVTTSGSDTADVVGKPKGDYQTLEKDLKQDRVTDAVTRVQMLEQEVRFLKRRVEFLERDVNDIKNDRYNRVNP